MDHKNMLNDKELGKVVGGAASGNIEYEGVVADQKPGGLFSVKLENRHVIEARLSAKLRLNNIRVIVGDTVTVEVSPYDAGHGKIISVH